MSLVRVFTHQGIECPTHRGEMLPSGDPCVRDCSGKPTGRRPMLHGEAALLHAAEDLE